ncbi:NirD/YgiW/YdeI family stress tolerance protein [uncultured Desulfovibrio sp.]|uniref:NirD/YgiW/YdeI family stress tolerance protein n=1 Tax=uncultured Desulfovibrio sp. TaxID=167968 RepID=UPI002614B10E|nr:NirD/YgiW/YdeI family stress tolerance protein [uncultured Desulfovibrio sp.]
MKIFSLLLLAMSLSVPALAAPDGVPGPADAGGYQGPAASYGGFQGPTGGTDNDTVAKALKAWDESPVLLTGNIVERLAGSDDKYMFRDATGQIIVDIDHELFWGKTVTPANTVRIAGEVDKEMFEATKIDVKFLEVIK